MPTPRRTIVALVAAATLTGGLLAACSKSGGDDTATSTTTSTAVEATTTTTTASTTTTSEAATTTSSGGGATTTTVDPGSEGTETGRLDTDLAPGEHYGYFAGSESMTAGGKQVFVLLWDEAQFLTGDAAVAAAQAHGAIPKDQTYIDDDYYIVNDNQKVRRLALGEGATITKVDPNGSGQVPATAAEVSKDQGLYKITLSGAAGGAQTVTHVEGVFLP